MVTMQLGLSMTAGGGCVAVGDIAGAPAGEPTMTPYGALLDHPMGGISFVEFFSIGKGEMWGRARIAELLCARLEPWEGHPVLPAHLGLQPHAPTTVSLATYSWLLKQPQLKSYRLSTHLAETPEEREFIATGKGPQRGFMEALALWEDRILEEVGHGRTPVEHLAAVLGEAPFLCAHVNDASDRDIDLLARTPTSVAYCPRASDYFGAHDHFGPHRYRDMLAAGINVCLGTDSIINQPAGTNRLSTLDEMRFLFRRDKTDAVTLLRMATVNGAKALGLKEEHFAFTPGSHIAGIVAVPFTPTPGLSPLEAALSCDSAPELKLIGK
jgi:cytosine/adenosine deaminase-related metal-dependent hydrolase